MRLKTAITSVSTVALTFDLAASKRGTSVLTPNTSLNSFNLDDVTAASYQTVFSVGYRVEDVGLIEVLSLNSNLNIDFKGNGSFRWQISGDGGTTWVTMVEITGITNPGFVNYQITGVGLWIPQISAGNNKLQVRLQVLATSGTVSTILYDDTSLLPTYRKKVLT